MRLSDYRARIRDIADEYGADNIFWSDTMLDRFINDARREFARRTKSIISKETVALVEGQREYSFPTRVIEISEIVHNGKPLAFGGEHILDDIDSEWRTSDNGTPAVWYTRGKTFVVDPAPSSTAISDDSNFTLTCIKIPADLSGSADDTEIRPEHQDIIALMATRKALLRDREFELADRVQRDYVILTNELAKSGLKYEPSVRFIPSSRYYPQDRYEMN